MEQEIYQVDAFTSEMFGGNPAAVCPLDHWLDDGVMQAVAGENNLSETAFFVREEGGWRIRWFTPTVEVDLCGHATLASAHVLFEHCNVDESTLSFESQSGPLSVRPLLVLDFPSKPPVQCVTPGRVIEGLGLAPTETLASANYMAVFEHEAEVAGLEPDFRPLVDLGGRGLIVTAPGDDCDFVSRYFAPAWGIDEDPATGSTHCELTPYWSKRLGRTSLHARQVSARGAEFRCELRGDRVDIAGRAVTYLIGHIHLPEGA
jgi:predicted PhzF superfamily epimerase YddE/YHI9